MARQAKPHINVNIKMDKDIAQKLNEFAAKNYMTKTSVIERALAAYFEENEKTGKV